MHAAASEADLITSAQLGNEDAFCELVRRHQAVVRAFLGRFVRNPSDVDDLAQEVFLSAYRDLAACSGGIRSWLFTIARHRATTWLRDAERLQRREGRYAEARLSAWQAAEAQCSHGEERELEALRHCLGALPLERRAQLQSYYGEQSDVPSEKRPLKLTMFRLRQRLRQCIDLRLAQMDNGHG